MRQKNKGMKKTGVLGFVILCLLSGCAQQSTESTEATTVAAVEAEVLETVELKRAEVGDIVQMGNYEQDGDTETEDPIYWDVLDKDGDSILIISHDVIGYQRFSDSPNCVIWEDSQIRTWLNEEFYTDAFDKETQARIKGYVTSGVDEANQESRGDATDRIFLLSQKEIEKYYGHKLPKAEALLCKPSKAVLQRYEEIKQQRVREKIPFAESAPNQITPNDTASNTHMIKFASKLNALLRCSSKYIVPLLQISCAHLSLSKNTTVAPET